MKFEEPFVAAYRDYQVDLAVLFGANRATAVTEMGQVLEFEFELAEVTKKNFFIMRVLKILQISDLDGSRGTQGC